MKRLLLLLIFQGLFIFHFAYGGDVYFNNDPHYEFWGVSNNNLLGEPKILDILPDIENNYVYIAGDFDIVGLNIGNGSFFSATSGNLLISTTSLKNLRINKAVYAAVPDNLGGFYIAGDFDLVGTTSVGRIIHVLADGTLDNNFKPIVNNTVLSLALSSDGSTLYIGGYFTQVNSTTKNYIAALNTSDGSLVSGFNADANYAVYSLALSPDGEILYIGGFFGQVNSTTKNRIAALNTSDGSLVSGFNADANYTVYSLVLSPDGSTLYIGGGFTQINSTTKNRIAALNTSDGSLVSGFNADVDNTVYSLVLSPDGSTLYIGGGFTQINSTTKNRIAALNTSDGSLVSGFNADVDNTLFPLVFSLAISSDGSILYIGGFFTQVNSTTKNYIAALNTSDGSLVGSFNLNINGLVYKISYSNNKLFIGGELRLGNVQSKRGLARFNLLTDEIDNSFNFDTNGIIAQIKFSPDKSKVYVAGLFTEINGISRSNIAAINTFDGSLFSGFNADVDNTVYSLALSPDGSTLYIGGGFTQVNSTTKNRIAALNTFDGSLVSGFNADANNTVYSLALSSDGEILYLGGDFTQINSTTKNRIAALNTSDGFLFSGFNADVDNTIRSLVLSPDGSTLYIGGGFTQVNSTTKNRIAALNTSDGSLFSGFNADVDNTVYSLALSPDGSTLYIGGGFTQVNSTTKNYIAALNTFDGSLVSYFNPSFSGSILKIVVNNDLLITGGSFILVNDQVRPMIAVFAGLSKIEFISSMQNVIAGNFSNNVSFVLKDFYNNAFQPATSVLIYLTSTSANGSFYPANNTSTAISQLSIINTATSSFYYKDTKAGAHSLKILALPYASSTQNITILPAVTSTNIMINNNNPETTSTNVILTLIATYLDDFTFSKQVKISNNGVNYATITFATTVLWNLGDVNYGGNHNYGNKTVFVIFLDAYNNEVGPITDSIAYVSSMPPSTNRGASSGGASNLQTQRSIDLKRLENDIKKILQTLDKEKEDAKKKCQPYISDYKVNSQNIVKIKIFLNKFENTKLKINGLNNNEFKKALSSFQKKYKLKIKTGVVTKETINKINVLYCLSRQ